MAVAFCIKNGHPPQIAWRYTPRELSGWMDFHSRSASVELALLLRVIATGASGDAKAVQKLTDELLKHGS